MRAAPSTPGSVLCTPTSSGERPTLGVSRFRHHIEEALRVEPDLADQDRAFTASVMLKSGEAHRRFVAEEYRTLLRRNPERSALDFWTERLGHGLPRPGLVIALVASDEYHAAHS